MTRLRPLRAVGLGAVLGLGATYPLAQLYAPSRPVETTTAAAAGAAGAAAVVVQPAGAGAGQPSAARGPDPSASATRTARAAAARTARPARTASGPAASTPAPSATAPRPSASATRAAHPATSSAPPSPPATHTATPAPRATTPKPTPSPTPTARTLRVTGPTEQTPYGPVQVQVTVVVSASSERITSASAVRLPSGGTSGQISAYAGPRLDQETLAAQSASIHTVSGASYTSAGYRSSLQAALVAARRA